MAALAVLVVGVFCTSAGCLLTMQTPSIAKTTLPACCSEQQRQGTQPNQSNNCPACRQSVVLAKSVDGGQRLIHSISTFHFEMPPGCVASPVVYGNQAVSAFSLVPFQPPPTLLALHCALIT